MSAVEIWKPVVGFEGSYEVSNLGRVRSLDRWITQQGKAGSWQTRMMRGRILRPAVNKKRGFYRYVNLAVAGVNYQHRVCVLVSAAFLGPRLDGQETCHRNGIPGDDRLENLRYGTHRSNLADMEAHGTRQRGEAVPVSRLKEPQVLHILSSAASADALADLYGVHPGHINNIRRGVRWAHVRSSRRQGVFA